VAATDKRVLTLIDLSQEIYQGMLVYPGHLNTVIWDYHTHEGTVGKFDSDLTYATKGLILSDHGPTHVDSISHFDPSPDAATIDAMPLEGFWGPATCLDISGAADQRRCTADDLDAALAGGDLRPDDILLLHTGNPERNAGRPEYLTDYPGLDASAAEWLAARELKAFGIDAPTPDIPGDRIYPVHLMSRREGLPHYENLANLGAVAGRRFTFFGLPLKVRGGHGSPVRATALLDG
jgi:kynurenine formamidase